MQEQAYLLQTRPAFPEGEQIQKLLRFFGITPGTATTEEFNVGGASSAARTDRVFCSAASFLHLIGSGGSTERLHSVFVHSDRESTSELLALLSDGIGIPVRDAVASSEWAIADAADGFGGPMSGLRVTPRQSAGERRPVADVSGSRAIAIISAGGCPIFFRLDWKGIPIFVSLAEQIIDLDDELTTPNFDIRDHFFSAVPIMLYIRWAFPATSWQALETGACLVIDDPLLKPRYGFVRFQSLLELMERHGFSTSIAFIPWNWRRSDPATVQLFKQNPGRLSFCVHGCDHTAAEWGIDDAHQLRAMIGTVEQRMAAHDRLTGLAHDRVMVFPQGVFSPTAMRELKRANYLAVVNTEVKTSGATIKIGDAWDVALRNYSDMPLYTRRYPQQGIENLAFDVLIGKPCLIVIHHDFCRDNGAHLGEFVQRVNSLKARLRWRSLQDIVRRSYRIRHITPGVAEIEMYGAEMLIENRAGGAKVYRIKHRATDAETVAEIRAGTELVPWVAVGEYLHFEVTLPAGAGALIKVRRTRLEQNGRGVPLRSGFKTGLRRYLSEFRDNYVAPAKARFAGSPRN
jgi:hypothetical protein